MTSEGGYVKLYADWPAVLNATDSHPAIPRQAEARLTESDLQQGSDFIAVSRLG
jgi:hypothetical protein